MTSQDLLSNPVPTDTMKQTPLRPLDPLTEKYVKAYGMLWSTIFAALVEVDIALNSDSSERVKFRLHEAIDVMKQGRKRAEDFVFHDSQLTNITLDEPERE